MNTATLVDILAKKESQITQLTEELRAQRLLTEKLQGQLENLLRILYGKKSEKKSSAKEPKNESETNIPSNDPTDSKPNSKVKGQPVRKKLPPNLEREVIKHELPESERICYLCGNICQCIGKEVTEQLEYIPARLFVKEHRRYKYGCRNGCEVKIASMPLQPIPKGIPGPSLLAEILINKYQDSLPLYRQSLRFKRHGLEIPESTLCDWVSQVARLLKPLVRLMHKDILRLSKIHTDDTPVPVLAKGKTKQGRLWVYIADGKNGPACTIYDYSVTRSQTAPLKFLLGYKGYLQADAYPGYDEIYANGDVIEVGCMAHARRKFFEVAESAKGDSLAQDALNIISEIYLIEDKGREMHYLRRYYYRKQYLRKVYRKLHRWLVKKKRIVLPNTPIEKAFNYALNHWRALQNVFADGRLEVDNNIGERGMRIIAVGRKNWLFAGSDQGGHNSATIYSMLETAKQNGLNTFEYLSDILARLPSTSEADLVNLLPYNYSQ